MFPDEKVWIQEGLFAGHSICWGARHTLAWQGSMKEGLLAELLEAPLCTAAVLCPQGDVLLPDLQVEPHILIIPTICSAAFVNYHCEDTMQTFACCIFSAYH